jgi:hypothetical protein
MSRGAILFVAAWLCSPSAFAHTVLAPTDEPARTTDIPPVETLTTFDSRLAELRWDGNRWQLWAGDVWLKDFGKHESEAREALRLVRELRLTQHGSIGTPQPVVEYWLAGGHAPQGPSASLRTFPFEPANLHVDPIQGQWCLRDRQRISFMFTKAEEARQALAVIRHYGFKRVGYLGQYPPAMMYFLGPEDGGAGAESPRNAPSHQPPKPPGTSGLLHSHSSQAEATGQHNDITPAALPSGRQSTASSLPPPGQPVIGDRVPFDWRQVQIRKHKQDWKLASGSYTLADFGPNERDARQALNAVQHYRFTEHCLIGRTTPSFAYFLVNGQEPRGLIFGVSDTPFEWELLSVRQLGGAFVISDGIRVLLNFGDKDDDAKQALQVIRRYQFDHLCHIGSPGTPGMTFLVRTRFRKQS